MGANASTTIAHEMFDQRKTVTTYPAHFEFDYNDKFKTKVVDQGVQLMPGGILAKVPDNPVPMIGDGFGVAGHLKIVDGAPAGLASEQPTIYPRNISPIKSEVNPPSECPMHQSPKKEVAAESAKLSSPTSYPSECPMSQSAQASPEMTKTYPSECPMSRGEEGGSAKSEVIDPTNMMPAPNQRPAPDQPFSLSTERITSNIPKADGSGETWVYPSPQMFWNAMLRKGWRWKESDLNQRDMDHIINIHNANNELAWREVLKWEALHADECMEPKLKKFSGFASKFSPRARMRSWLGYELPFDRHDWIVDRNGKDVRYIIDYYAGEKLQKDYEFALLDVRPAFDSPGAVYDRMKVCVWRWTSAFMPEDNTPAAPQVTNPSVPYQNSSVPSEESDKKVKDK